MGGGGGSVKSLKVGAYFREVLPIRRWGSQPLFSPPAVNFHVSSADVAFGHEELQFGSNFLGAPLSVRVKASEVLSQIDSEMQRLEGNERKERLL